MRNNHKKIILIGILLVIYTAYTYFFIQAVNLQDSFFDLSNQYFFLKLFLFIFPVCIIYVAKKWEYVIPLDFHAIYIPFLFWFVLVWIGFGKSETNVFVVNLPTVGISTKTKNWFIKNSYVNFMPMIKKYAILLSSLAVTILILSGCTNIPKRKISEATYTNKIVFFSERNGSAGIYVMNMNGENVQQLTNDTCVYPLSWSPDGQKIAFLSVRGRDYQKHPNGFAVMHRLLYIMDADGTHKKLLTELPMTIFTWSPDGKKIVFASSNEDPESFRADGSATDGLSSSAIYIIDVNGKNQKRLTDLTGDANFPSWSRNGKRIIFTSLHSTEMYSINPDGSDKQKLPDNSIYYYHDSWCPMQTNGEIIVFLDYEDYDIYTMDMNGQNKQNLTNSTARDLDPVLSPDGKKILFESLVNDNWELFIMNTDGSELTNISNNPGIDKSASWSPILK